MLLVALGQDEVGRRIKRARERAGLSQQELAAKAGLRHAQQISKYERGLVEIPVKRLARIAEATQVSLDSFLEDAAANNNGAQPATAVSEGELGAIASRLESAVERLADEARGLREVADRLEAGSQALEARVAQLERAAGA
jgi:transcriptional regulator with XRE-family HTH domain